MSEADHGCGRKDIVRQRRTFRRNDIWPHADSDLSFNYGQNVTNVFAGMDHAPDFRPADARQHAGAVVCPRCCAVEKLELIMKLPSLLAQLGIAHHAVAACMLGGVKSSVGKLYQVALELCISVINGHANADCKMLDGVRRTCKKFCLVHGAAQALGNVQRPRFPWFPAK